jgi:hypothetical protein
MLEERKATLLGDFNAMGGAIQDIDYWLDILAEEKVTAE